MLVDWRERMDNYCEQIVEKKMTSADMIRIVIISLALILGASACMFIAIFFRISFPIIFSVGLLGLGVWIVSGLNVEYEYIVTNNEMDIDKIIGRRKRKRMITVDLSKADDFGGYPPEEEIDADTTVHATTGLEKNAHYLLVEHNDYGKVKVIFNPNEKMREAIAQEVPKALSAKMKHDGK